MHHNSSTPEQAYENNSESVINLYSIHLNKLQMFTVVPHLKNSPVVCK